MYEGNEISQKQFNNLKYASEVMWPAIKPKEVMHDLSYWRDDTEDLFGDEQHKFDKLPKLAPGCGTTACFGGWLAVDPYFRRRGIRASPSGYPEFVDSKDVTDVISKNLFGTSGMFAPRGHFPSDPQEGDYTRRISDHKVVARRLAWMLKNTVVVKGRK